MAPTNRLEREAEDLANEYHSASIAARSMMQAQARLTQILSKHANVAVASIASMVQDIANAKTNASLKKQEITMTRAKLAAARKQHDLDIRTLQLRAQEMNTYRTLAAKGRSRSLTEEVEYHRLRAMRGTLRDNLNKASEAERKSANSVNVLAQSTQQKNSELRNIKFTAVATAANSLVDGMQKLVGTINKTQEQFGLAAGQAANLKVDNIVSSFNSYVESAKSLFSGKPEFGVSAEMIERAQAAYQNEFGGILTTDAAKDLAMQARTMGVTAEQLTKARRVFTTQSLGNVVEAKKSQDKFIAEFAKKGLTSKDAMQAISQYSELLARNGSRFQQSFARAAVDAKKIGVDLSKVSQIGDNIINNFEGFLESQANLGAMGFNFDSNRLAQIAETGSDADLFNELRSQMANTGKDITKLNRSERLELEGAYGINISDMLKLAGETPDGDTKSPEELQADANGFLSKIAVGMDLMARLLGVIANVALAAIAVNTSATALGVGGIAASIVGALLPIAAGIAIIAAVAQFWKFGSKNVEEGKRKIAAGEEGGAGQLIKGRAQQGGAIGAGTIASLAGIGAGLLLIGTGVGAPAGAAIIGASMVGGGLVGGAAGAGIGAGVGTAEAVATKGDDVISQPGYGKRSLVTPSGVIALNNKDNIIAYADDLMGNTKLPFGSISNEFAKLDEFRARANKVFVGLGDTITSKFQGVKQSIGNIFGASGEGLVGKFQQLSKSGSGFINNLKGNVLGKVQGTIDKFMGGGDGLLSKAQSLTGRGTTGLVGKAKGLLTNKTQGLLTKIPGAGGILGKATSLLGGGGLKSIGTSILGKVGLGNIVGSLAGGPLTTITSLAAPLLKKIPVIGTALGKITDAPGKLIGSAVGKVGGFIKGLFGKKKPVQAVSGAAGKLSFLNPAGLISKLTGEIADSAKNRSTTAAIGSTTVPSVTASVPATTSPMPGVPSTTGVTQSPSIIGQQPTQQQTTVNIDFTRLENKLDQVIRAIGSMEVRMDGNRVGKVLVNNSDSATTVGVFRQGAQATL